MKKWWVGLSVLCPILVIVGSVLPSRNDFPWVSQAVADTEQGVVRQPKAPKYPIAISWDDKSGRVVLKGQIETGSKFWEMYSVLTVEATDKAGNLFLYRRMVGEEWSGGASTSTLWTPIPDFTFTPQQLRVKAEYVLVYQDPRKEKWYTRAYHAMSTPLGPEKQRRRMWVNVKKSQEGIDRDRSLFAWMQKNKVIDNGVAYVFRKEIDMTKRKYKKSAGGP